MAAFTALMTVGCVGQIENNPAAAALSLGGISLTDTPQDIIAEIGPPQSVTIIDEICTAEEQCEDWNYGGLKINIYLGTPLIISSRSPKHCLSNGICPNDDISRVFERLGHSKIWPANSSAPPSLQYLLKNLETCWLSVFLTSKQDKVKELRLACQI